MRKIALPAALLAVAGLAGVGLAMPANATTADATITFNVPVGSVTASAGAGDLTYVAADKIASGDIQGASVTDARGTTAKVNVTAKFSGFQVNGKADGSTVTYAVKGSDSVDAASAVTLESNKEEALFTGKSDSVDQAAEYKWDATMTATFPKDAYVAANAHTGTLTITAA